MADNMVVKDAASADKTVALDEVSGVLYQVIKLVLGGDGLATFLSGGAGGVDTGTLRMTQASDDAVPAILANGAATITSTLQRPPDVAAYVANDVWSDSTTAPTAQVIANASRGSGKSGLITDILIMSSIDAAAALQGEIWIYDSAPAAKNDNSGFNPVDADVAKLVAIVPFTLASSAGSSGSGNNALKHIQNLNIGFTTVGSANLYFEIKVKAAYTPTSGEVLTVRTKAMRTN